MRGLEVKELVQAYMKNYEDIHDTDNISEYIDGLLPVYYGEIYNEYHQHIGTPLNIEITQDMVGMAFWQIMNIELYTEYYYQFMTEFNNVVEEMEEE